MQASNARAPQLFDTLVGVLNAAGVVWIFALMFLIGADIAARSLLDHPIAGVTEMVSLSLVACVFLQLAHAVLHGRLMRVEMFLEPLTRRHPVAAAVWNMLFAVLGIGILLTIVLGTWPDFVRAWEIWWFGDATKTPFAIACERCTVRQASTCARPNSDFSAGCHPIAVG